MFCSMISLCYYCPEFSSSSEFLTIVLLCYVSYSSFPTIQSAQDVFVQIYLFFLKSFAQRP